MRCQYIDEKDLALNNLHWLKCNKTKPDEIIYTKYVLVWFGLVWFGFMAYQRS